MLRKSSFTLNFIHFSLQGFSVDQTTETMTTKGSGRYSADGVSVRAKGSHYVTGGSMKMTWRLSALA